MKAPDLPNRFLSRQQKLRSVLEKHGIQSLVVSNLTNVYYLTGFRGSAGLCALGTGGAALFVDPRYTLQAHEQAQGVEVHQHRGRLLQGAGKWLEGGRARHTFVPVSARRFLTIRCRIAPGDATAQLLAAIGEQEVAGAVVRVVAEMEADQPVDQPAVRTAHAAAEWAGPVLREVRGASLTRNPQLTEHLTDPLRALDEYFKVHRISAARSRELREYAALLLAELEQEESVTYLEQ